MTTWRPARARLDDGHWHFQAGPIDLIIGAQGDEQICADAHEACWAAFGPVLPGLVAELSQLRRPCPLNAGSVDRLRGPVAQRMQRACQPYAEHLGVFITPMAAVAGSVAEELIDCYRREGVRRAFINNGGDIALHLAAGEVWRVGVVSNVEAPAIDAALQIEADSGLRGVATSGWRGRSLSLGIADSVTVVAREASAADAAATIIANHVDIEHPAIVRRPAHELRDDSDLGDLPVTVAVGALPQAAVERALDRGVACARRLRDYGWIDRVLIGLSGQWRVLGPADASGHRWVGAASACAAGRTPSTFLTAYPSEVQR